MNIEHFKSLIELQGLESRIDQHRQEIRREQNRISSLKEKVDDAKTLIEEKTTLLKEEGKEQRKEEGALSELEQKLEKSKEHLSSATSVQHANAAENEINTLTQAIDEKENLVLEILDSVETLKEEIEEQKSLIVELQKSITEIQKDVDENIHAQEQEIQNLEVRIPSLWEECPQDLKEVFSPIHDRFLLNSPLAFVENNLCNQCKYTINRNQQAMVNKAISFEMCPNCGRLLVPDGARSS